MLMHYQLVSVLLLSLLTLVVAGQGVCNGTQTPSEEVSLPPNMRALLDSMHYDQTVLPPHWLSVDLDGNNINGETTSAWLVEGTDCNRQFIVCGYTAGPQDNWLITKHINRSVNNHLLPQVTVRIDYKLNDCPITVEGDSEKCSRFLNIMKYETSIQDLEAAIDATNYGQAVSLGTNQTENIKTVFVDISFDSKESGFYLAVRDLGTCIVISRLVVLYYVCPDEIVNLEVRSETIAPPSGFITVDSSCSENAVPVAHNISLNCLEGGVWVETRYSGCVCDSGFYRTNNGQNCLSSSRSLPTTNCHPGFYVSEEAYGECLPCPNNSHSTQPDLSECPCNLGYYRAPQEVDLPCTLPPSPPRNVNIVDSTSTSVSLSWLEPLSTGGRDRSELKYILWYKYIMTGNIAQAATVTTTTGQISGLMTGVQYYLFVSAETKLSLMTFSDVLIFEPTEQYNFASSTHDMQVSVAASMIVIAIAVAAIILVICIIALWRKRKIIKLERIYTNEEAVTSSEDDHEPIYETIDDFQHATPSTVTVTLQSLNSLDSVSPFVDSTNPSYNCSSDEEFVESSNPSYNADIDSPASPDSVVSYYNIEQSTILPSYMCDSFDSTELICNPSHPSYMYNSLPDPIIRASGPSQQVNYTRSDSIISDTLINNSDI